MGRDLTKELKDIKISDIACSIEKELVHLIKTKPFYAHFIQTMDRIITESVETMGVNITDGINLFINPKFFNALKPKERVACLEHETLHILNKHILRSKNRNPDVFNIAGDIAVNQYIENLPKGALQPEQFKLEREKETEYYYKKLIKVKEKQYHPELVDIEIFNYSNSNWPKDTSTKNGTVKEVKKYIPLLFYDDLQECMLLNLQYLEDNEKKLLTPSILIEENIITIIDSKDYDDNFKIKNTWWSDFNNIKPDLFLDEMPQSFYK